MELFYFAFFLSLTPNDAYEYNDFEQKYIRKMNVKLV